MGFANWPAYQDGTGTYEDGNVPNKVLLDAIKASLEAGLFVGAVSAANLTTEVQAARGTQPSLDARLDVSLKENGRLKDIAGTITTNELVHTLGRVEPAPMLNPTFELWRYNTAAGTPWDPTVDEVPEGWELSDAGMSVLSHTAGGGKGSRYELLVSGDGQFFQKVIPETEMAGFMQQWQTGERKVTFGAIVDFALGYSGLGHLFVDDGVTVSYGPVITAIGAPGEHQSITHTINSHATYLKVGLVSFNTPPLSIAPQYVISAPYVTFNDLPIPADAAPGAPPTRWPYRTGMFHYPGSSMGENKIAGFNSLVHGNTAGGGQTVLWQFHDSVPADGVGYDATPIRIFASGTIAANADANKILRIYCGTSWVEIMNTALNVANNVWNFNGIIMRPAVNSAHLYGLFTHGAASLAVPTVIHVVATFAGGAINWAAATPISINGASATLGTVALQHGGLRLVGLR